MYTYRRCFVGFLSAMALSATLSGGVAAAGEFPGKPITLVVQASAGGASDFAARIVAQKLGTVLGGSVVIENMPAAGGMLATRKVLHATPDGYTLLVYGTKAAIAESLFKTRPYNLAKDLIPVGFIGSSDIALVVDRKSPLKSIGDLTAEIKARPGRVTVGVGDTIGGIQHLSAELLKAALQGDFLIVPFGSIAKLVAAVRSGEVDVAFELTPAVASQIKAEEMRALATTGSQRSMDLPNVPTLAESGIANADVTATSMIATPAGTPAAVVTKLNDALNLVLGQRDVQEALRSRGSTPAPATSSADAQRLMEAQVSKWRDAVRLAKVPLQ